MELCRLHRNARRLCFPRPWNEVRSEREVPDGLRESPRSHPGRRAPDLDLHPRGAWDDPVLSCRMTPPMSKNCAYGVVPQPDNMTSVTSAVCPYSALQRCARSGRHPCELWAEPTRTPITARGDPCASPGPFGSGVSHHLEFDHRLLRRPPERTPPMAPEVTRRAMMLGSVGAASATALAACSTGQQADEDRPIRIKASDTTTFQRNLNPYSTMALQGVDGLIFEPLRVTTEVDVENPEPWLATEFEWNEDGTVLTVALRDGARWTDGEAFDAEDVVFTFLMMRDVPATHTAALAIVDRKSTRLNS